MGMETISQSNSLFPLGVPHGITLVTLSVEDRPIQCLKETERQIAEQFSNLRRLNCFIAGRLAADKALQALQHSDAVGRAVDGSPLWPDGVVGSISHTQQLAGAAVASEKKYTRIGLDLEVPRTLRAPVWRRIATPNEKERLHRLIGEERDHQVCRLFSLKEAAFKALSQSVFQPKLYETQPADEASGTIEIQNSEPLSYLQQEHEGVVVSLVYRSGEI